jgi:hypothetical protein
MLLLLPLIPEYEVKVQLDMLEDNIVVTKSWTRNLGPWFCKYPAPNSSAASTRPRNCCNELLRGGKLQLQTRFRPWS